jgi:predicted MFS family arabinose efflux permease
MSFQKALSAMPQGPPPPRASPFLTYFIALATGAVVANLYYCQPLLGRLAYYFHASDTAASWVNICSQMGYGLGLFFVAPLGDKVPRRRLLVVMILAAAASLCGIALAPNMAALYVFSLCAGIATTACQVFVPLAAHLATDEERGRVIGIVMGGLLSGILLSRTLSGLAAEAWGWRSIFWIAAGLMLLISALVFRFIPAEEAAFKGSYRQLLGSLFQWLRREKLVRESSWIGACLFGAISVFWSTMAFFLEGPPYFFSISVIGLFGIVGMAGALISPQAGRLSDRRGFELPMRWGIAIMLAGFLLLFESMWHLAFLIAGIVLIDAGLQAAHIPNLSRMSSLAPEARTRLNTIYMSSFFVGGTLGSVLGSYAWRLFGWDGVCAAGLALVAAGGLPLYMRSLRKRG